MVFEDWLDNQYHLVTRLVGKHHLLRFSGGFGPAEADETGQWVSIQARQLAEQIPTPHGFNKLIKRKGRPVFRITQIGWVKVCLTARKENLTLVVSRLAGCDTPLTLLTNLPVENVSDAKRVLHYYI